MEKGSVVIKHFLLILSVFLMTSCARESVLIVTDPFWEDFSEASGQNGFIGKHLIFLKKGICPDFKIYNGLNQDFPSWFDQNINQEKYDAIITTYPYFTHLSKIVTVPLTLIGGFAPMEGINHNQVVSVNYSALYTAGGRLKSDWVKDNRIPLVILCKGRDAFDSELNALMAGWGENEEILSENTFILEEKGNDADDKLSSFYHRFDFSEGLWSLLVAADPFLMEVVKAWPDEENLSGILSIPDSKYLPDNVDSIIIMDTAGILDAAACIIQNKSGSETVEVESILMNR